MTRLLVIGIACLAAVAVAFPAAGLTPTPSPTTTPTVTPAPPAVPGAAAFRDELLTLALGNLDAQEAAAFNGFFPAWKTAHPGLGGDGSAIPSIPGRVSTIRTLLHSKDVPAPDNPTVIAFAVAGSDGACAGAVIYGFPKTDKNAKFAVSGACTAQSVVAQFAASQQPTPPPITTVPPTITAVDTGPKPPAVGDSMATEKRSLPLLFGLGALLVGCSVAVAAGIAVRRERYS